MSEVATPGAVVGPYRLGRVLGRGGMAVVYEATHESVGRTVALKLLGGELAQDAGFVERFRREGQLQATLEHPHVVTVYEAGSWQGGLYLAMQLVPGPTLAALIERGALTVQRTLTLHRQVAEALDAAHAAGLVHRDVKPRNVLVAPGDHAYLADFGITKAGDAPAQTATGNLLGTVAYLSPEVIKGERATSASDRYAFAAMLFECLTGTVVFRARRTRRCCMRTRASRRRGSRRAAAIFPPRSTTSSSARCRRTRPAARAPRRRSSPTSSGSCASTTRSGSGRRRRHPCARAATRTRRGRRATRRRNPAVRSPRAAGAGARHPLSRPARCSARSSPRRLR